MRIVVAHGGTTSSPRQRDGTRKAAEAGLALLDQGPLAAVVEACRVLEDDERFHAGTGGSLRMDGWTLEMDAACADSTGRFGGVGAIQRVRNPVLVAQALSALPNNILVGSGATSYARTLGMPDHDPMTEKARKQWRDLVGKMEAGKAGPGDTEWDEPTLRKAWNYARPFDEVFPRGLKPPSPDTRGSSTDTVGAVATDGRTFAAAASTSGMTASLQGRVGDTLILGAGLLATEHGAVACSGNGDHILRRRFAARVLRHLEDGLPPKEAARQVLELLPQGVDGGVAVLGAAGWAVEGNVSFAFSAAEA